MSQRKEEVYLAPLNFNFVPPGTPQKCTWYPNIDPTSTPHSKQTWESPRKIAPDVLSLIGNTPMVKLNKIPEKYGLKCDIYAKLEFLNPGGSVKDRICRRLIEDAERLGVLKPGSTIIEPSSGNTGVGMAMAAAVKGYRCIIVINERMSDEKIYTINALGAEAVRVPYTAPNDSHEGIFGVAHKLKKEIPNSVIFDQFSHPGNPLAHYDTTAEEILEQLDNQVDMIVMGAGTGGTVTGIGRKFKEKSPNTKIVVSDPVGSLMAEPEEINVTDITFFEVEGMGYDFIPGALDRSVVDLWVKTTDKDSFPMSRKLIRDEGILCGGSSGAILAAAVKAAKDLNEGQNVVVIIPDSIRNYLTKFVCDQWMEERGLQPCINKNNLWWWDKNIFDLDNLKQLRMISADETCGNAMSLMGNLDVRQLVVVDENGHTLGAITKQKLMKELISKSLKTGDHVSKSLIRLYPKAHISSNLGLFSRILEVHPYVVVINQIGTGHSKIEKPVAIIEAAHIYDYIMRNEQK